MPNYSIKFLKLLVNSRLLEFYCVYSPEKQFGTQFERLQYGIYYWEYKLVRYVSLKMAPAVVNDS